MTQHHAPSTAQGDAAYGVVVAPGTVRFERMNRDGIVGVSGGWHTHLGVLADRLSGRTPPGFWRTFMAREADYQRLTP